MARHHVVHKDASARLLNIYRHMAHMISSVYASIHLSNMIEIERCVINKSAKTTVQDSPVHGHVHVDSDMTSML